VIGYSEPVYFSVDTPPRISVLSSENATYETTDILLNFTINQPASHITYSLDGEKNVTVAEHAKNITLNGLTNGLHNVTIYAWDSTGNSGTSETVNFTIAEEPAPEPFPTAIVATASGTSAAVVSVGILVYFRKRKRLVVK
jgi:hypothetical protein